MSILAALSSAVQHSAQGQRQIAGLVSRHLQAHGNQSAPLWVCWSLKQLLSTSTFGSHTASIQTSALETAQPARLMADATGSRNLSTSATTAADAQPVATSSADLMQQATQQLGQHVEARPYTPRQWVWFSAKEERQEQVKEIKRIKYFDAGHAHMLDVPQSMKKMNRILKLVRGLTYEDAVHQCKVIPHKAAKYLMQTLEAARKDAEIKQLDLDTLIVDEAYCTKGHYERGGNFTRREIWHHPKSDDRGGRFHARGRKFMLTTRKTHVRVLLRENPTYGGWRARVTAPLMERQYAPPARPKRILGRHEA